MDSDFLPRPFNIQCLHCGLWFKSIEDVRRHQTLNEMLANEPQIFEWSLEPNYINGEWEND